MKILIRIIAFSIPFLILFVFLILDIRMGGVLEAELIPEMRTPYMYAPLPSTRVRVAEYKGESVYEMTGEPAYFSLRLPKTAYDRVTVGIEFIPEKQTVLEMGPEAYDGAQAFDLRPVFQEALERLDWSVREDYDVRIYEKTPRVGAYERSQVATYAYEFPSPYRDLRYAPGDSIQTYEVDLRGSHRMKTYIKDEALNMQFVFTDMNREIGRDDIVIRVYDESRRMVRELRVNDDGNERADQEVMRHDVSLMLEQLDEGVYEIEINTNTDIFLRTISTMQRKLVFLNRLYVGDPVGWRHDPARTVFVGNGQAYTLQTLHNEGLQTVFFNQSSVQVNETHRPIQFILDKPQDILDIRVPEGNMLLVSEGVFALTRDAFFVPDPRVISPFTNMESTSLSAVYTTYESPERAGDWLIGEQIFATEEWWNDKRGNVRFALSAPFIETHEGRILIKRIYIRFEKPQIKTVRGLLEAMRERVPFGL